MGRPKGLTKAKSRSFTVCLPEEMLEEIDTICFANFMTRTNWMFLAAREKLEKDRKLKLVKVLEDLEEREK